MSVEITSSQPSPAAGLDSMSFEDAAEFFSSQQVPGLGMISERINEEHLRSIDRVVEEARNSSGPDISSRSRQMLKSEKNSSVKESSQTDSEKAAQLLNEALVKKV